MKLYDLSLLISEGLPTYPGDPSIVITSKNKISVQGYNVLNICMGTHSGTHVDAPLHLIEDGDPINLLSVEKFLGLANFIEILKGENEIIVTSDLEKFEICQNDILIVRTGWEDKCYNSDYFIGFPYFSSECAEYLISKGIKALGADIPSVDGPQTNASFHKKILTRNIPIIEALINLKLLIGKKMMFCSFPLRIENSDGSPVRAVAFEM